MVGYSDGKQFVKPQSLENYKLYDYVHGHRCIVEENTMDLIVPMKYTLSISYTKNFMLSKVRFILLKFY